MDDFQGLPGLLFDQHIKSTKEDMDKLVLLDGEAAPDRKGRNNVPFFPLVKLDQVVNWLKAEMEEGTYVYSFP